MAFAQPDILPAAAEAIHRVLTSVPGGRLSPDSLVERIVPDGGDGRTKVVHDTLHELRAVGAIVNTDDQLALCADADSVLFGEGMRGIVLSAIVDESRRPELWETTEDEPNNTGGLDLVRALAWTSLLQVTGPAWSWDGPASAQQEQADRLTPAVVRNPTRWPPFVRWATYLGFASTLGNYTLVPDPTVAVGRVLQRHLERRDFQPLREVIVHIGATVPMLDGGIVNAAMQDRYPVRWESDVSPALTLALARLGKAGRVTFNDRRGDAEKVVLADEHGTYNAMRWESEAN